MICDKAQGQIRVFRYIASLYELQRLQVFLEKAGFMVNQVYGDYDKKVLAVIQAGFYLAAIIFDSQSSYVFYRVSLKSMMRLEQC